MRSGHGVEALLLEWVEGAKAGAKRVNYASILGRSQILKPGWLPSRLAVWPGPARRQGMQATRPEVKERKLKRDPAKSRFSWWLPGKSCARDSLGCRGAVIDTEPSPSRTLQRCCQSTRDRGRKGGVEGLDFF